MTDPPNLAFAESSFFLVAAVVWKLGPPIKSFIDRHLNLLGLGFTVLLIGGFAVVKYVL